MKVQIRRGIFETNSSSTHTLVIATKSDYEKWKKGVLYLKRYGDNEFYTREEVIAELRGATWIDTTTLTDDEVMEAALEEDWTTYENFGSCYLEEYKTHFTTPSGDEMVVFGEYGYDG